MANEWMTNEEQKAAYVSYQQAKKAYDDYVLKLSNIYRNTELQKKAQDPEVVLTEEESKELDLIKHGLSVPMTAQEIQELKNLSEQLITTGQNMKVTLNKTGQAKMLAAKKERTPEENEILKGERELELEIKRTNRTANRELSYIETADPQNLPSYNSLHRQTSEPVIDTGEGALEKVGGFMSDRIPIRYMDENGQLVEGFFTQDYSPEWTIDEIYDRATAVAPTMKDIVDRIKADNKLQMLKENISSIEANNQGALDPDGMKNLFDAIGLPKELYENRTFSYEETSAIDDLGKRSGYLEVMKATHNGVGIESGSNINQRNTAMYDVAKLLGCEDQIAKSDPMTIIVNGQPVHGNFMRKVEGVQVGDAIDPQNPIRPTDGAEFSVDYKTLGERCGNLLIIDYICANVDRHEGNIFFTMEPSKDGKGNMVMNGVVGIDNDLSFGSNKADPKKAMKNLPALNDIVSIPKDLAEKVKKLDKDTLAAVLVKNGISPSQINACWDRVQQLQNKIQKDKDFVVDGYTEAKFNEIADRKAKYASDFQVDTPFKHARKAISEVSNFFKRMATSFRDKLNEFGNFINKKITDKFDSQLNNDKEYQEWVKQAKKYKKHEVPEELKKKITDRHNEREAIRAEKQKEMATVAAKAKKAAEKAFKDEYNEKLAVKRSAQGVKKLHQKLYMDSTGTLKGQAAELNNLMKRLKKLGEGQGQEYADMMNAAESLSNVLNPVAKSKNPVTDKEMNLAAERFKELQQSITKFIPSASGKNADKLVAAAECLDNMCDIAKNSRERQVNELNELMVKAFKELNSSKQQLDRIKADKQLGENSIEYKLADEAFEAKKILAGSVGNLGPMEGKQIDINSKAIAKLALVEHIKSLKEAEPGVYDKYAEKLNADPKYLDAMANVLVTGKSFNTLISNVNVYTAIITKPENHIAKELDKNLKLKVFDEITTGERDLNGKFLNNDTATVDKDVEEVKQSDYKSLGTL